VDDVVQANLLAMEVEGVSGQVFNVACGQQTSILELAEVLGELVGEGLLTEFESPRPGDIRFSQAAIERANKALGYRPLIPLREGLKETIAYFAKKT
jgi:nucleoside-diphosphate-sugar epimerase